MDSSKCQMGGSPDHCLCDVASISVPTNVELSEGVFKQLLNSKAYVKVQDCLRTKEIKKEDVPSKDKWPRGVKKINVPSHIKVTPKLLKQLFCATLVNIKKP